MSLSKFNLHLQFNFLSADIVVNVLQKLQIFDV